MRNQLRNIAALFVFTAVFCVACQKEKIPAPSNEKQATVTSQSKTDNSAPSSDQSHNNSTSGCHHGG